METSIDVPVAASASACTIERTSTNELLCRIRGEYLEVPGLNLTRQQAKRLWALDDVTCDRLLKLLVESRFLRRTPSGTYVRVQ